MRCENIDSLVGPCGRYAPYRCTGQYYWTCSVCSCCLLYITLTPEHNVTASPCKHAKHLHASVHMSPASPSRARDTGPGILHPHLWHGHAERLTCTNTRTDHIACSDLVRTWLEMTASILPVVVALRLMRSQRREHREHRLPRKNKYMPSTCS